MTVDPSILVSGDECPEAEILSTVTASIGSLGCLSKYSISRTAAANISSHGGFRNPAQARGCRVFAVVAPLSAKGKSELLNWDMTA
jgi:hypothetical protein